MRKHTSKYRQRNQRENHIAKQAESRKGEYRKGNRQGDLKRQEEDNDT